MNNKKCKFCGFDPNKDSIISEGAPCGVNGCTLMFCCMESWAKHKKLYHNGEK